ncbi:hypothetical protein MLD38_009373 [Melastoma candidum]|uniref:Uncharacterized protein n=1 Tax=Melastoma candidum TaxID=119954 RepID=A0ACB9RX14_9MYRT|nr:hypothetical protein MLD38_009373 [Melastoma candidum]
MQPQPQPQQSMFPAMPSFPPTNITTEQIQKFLDENKKLILAILDNQNLGKLSECAQYQAQLQKNLMYLAAIADSQPPTPTIPAQVVPHPAMQQGAYFMQHPQAAVMSQQQGHFPPKMQMQFGGPHQVHDPQLSMHQQQAIQSQVGMRPVGPGNGLHPLSAESLGGGVSGAQPPSSSGMIASKQDGSDAGNTSTDGHGSAPSRHPSGDGEQS